MSEDIHRFFLFLLIGSAFLIFQTDCQHAISGFDQFQLRPKTSHKHQVFEKLKSGLSLAGNGHPIRTIDPNHIVEQYEAQNEDTKASRSSYRSLVVNGKGTIDGRKCSKNNMSAECIVKDYDIIEDYDYHDVNGSKQSVLIKKNDQESIDSDAVYNENRKSKQTQMRVRDQSNDVTHLAKIGALPKASAGPPPTPASPPSDKLNLQEEIPIPPEVETPSSLGQPPISEEKIKGTQASEGSSEEDEDVDSRIAQLEAEISAKKAQHKELVEEKQKLIDDKKSKRFSSSRSTIQDEIDSQSWIQNFDMQILDLEDEIGKLNTKIDKKKAGKKRGGKGSKNRPKSKGKKPKTPKGPANIQDVTRKIQKLSASLNNIEKNLKNFEGEFEEFEREPPASSDRCKLMLQSFEETLNVIEDELEKEISQREDARAEYDTCQKTPELDQQLQDICDRQDRARETINQLKERRANFKQPPKKEQEIGAIVDTLYEAPKESCRSVEQIREDISSLTVLELQNKIYDCSGKEAEIRKKVKRLKSARDENKKNGGNPEQLKQFTEDLEDLVNKLECIIREKKEMQAKLKSLGGRPTGVLKKSKAATGKLRDIQKNLEDAKRKKEDLQKEKQRVLGEVREVNISFIVRFGSQHEEIEKRIDGVLDSITNNDNNNINEEDISKSADLSEDLKNCINQLREITLELQKVEEELNNLLREKKNRKNEDWHKNYEPKVKNCHKDITGLNDKKKKLKTRVREFNVRYIVRFGSQQEEIARKVEQIMEGLGGDSEPDEHEQVVYLYDDLDELQLKINQLSKKKRELKKKQQDLANLEEELKQLSSERKELISKIREYDTPKYETYQQQSNTVVPIIDELLTDIDIICQKCHYTRDFPDLLKRINNLLREKQELLKKFNKLREERNREARPLKKCIRDIKATQAKYKKLENEKQNLHTQLKEFSVRYIVRFGSQQEEISKKVEDIMESMNQEGQIPISDEREDLYNDELLTIADRLEALEMEIRDLENAVADHKSGKTPRIKPVSPQTPVSPASSESQVIQEDVETPAPKRKRPVSSPSRKSSSSTSSSSLTSIQRQIKALGEEIEAKCDHIDELDRKKEELVDKLEDLREGKGDTEAESRARLHALHKKLAKLVRDGNGVSKELDQLRLEKDKCGGDAALLSDANKRIEAKASRLQKIRNEKARIQAEITQIQNERKVWKHFGTKGTPLKEAEEDMDKITRQIEDELAEIEQLQARRDSLIRKEQRLKVAKPAPTPHQQDVQSCSAKIDEIFRKLDELEAKKERLVKKLEAIKEEKPGWETYNKICELQKKIGKLIRDSNGISKELRRLRKEKAEGRGSGETDKLIESKAAQIRRLTNEKKKLKAAIKQLKEERKVKQYYGIKSNSVKELEDDIDQISLQIDNLQLDLDKKQEELDALQNQGTSGSEAENFDSKIAETDRELSRINDDQEAAKAELEKAKAEYADTENRIKEAKEEEENSRKAKQMLMSNRGGGNERLYELRAAEEDVEKARQDTQKEYERAKRLKTLVGDIERKAKALDEERKRTEMEHAKLKLEAERAEREKMAAQRALERAEAERDHALDDADAMEAKAKAEEQRRKKSDQQKYQIDKKFKSKLSKVLKEKEQEERRSAQLQGDVEEARARAEQAHKEKTEAEKRAREETVKEAKTASELQKVTAEKAALLKKLQAIEKEKDDCDQEAERITKMKAEALSQEAMEQCLQEEEQNNSRLDELERKFEKLKQEKDALEKIIKSNQSNNEGQVQQLIANKQQIEKEKAKAREAEERARAKEMEAERAKSDARRAREQAKDKVNGANRKSKELRKQEEELEKAKRDFERQKEEANRLRREQEDRDRNERQREARAQEELKKKEEMFRIAMRERRVESMKARELKKELMEINKKVDDLRRKIDENKKANEDKEKYHQGSKHLRDEDEKYKQERLAAERETARLREERLELERLRAKLLKDHEDAERRMKEKINAERRAQREREKIRQEEVSRAQREMEGAKRGVEQAEESKRLDKQLEMESMRINEMSKQVEKANAERQAEDEKRRDAREREDRERARRLAEEDRLRRAEFRRDEEGRIARKEKDGDRHFNVREKELDKIERDRQDEDDARERRKKEEEERAEKERQKEIDRLEKIKRRTHAEERRLAEIRRQKEEAEKEKGKKSTVKGLLGMDTDDLLGADLLKDALGVDEKGGYAYSPQFNSSTFHQDIKSEAEKEHSKNNFNEDDPDVKNGKAVSLEKQMRGKAVQMFASVENGKTVDSDKMVAPPAKDAPIPPASPAQDAEKQNQSKQELNSAILLLQDAPTTPPVVINKAQDGSKFKPSKSQNGGNGGGGNGMKHLSGTIFDPKEWEKISLQSLPLPNGMIKIFGE